jgi:hypothetical protein
MLLLLSLLLLSPPLLPPTQKEEHCRRSLGKYKLRNVKESITKVGIAYDIIPCGVMIAFETPPTSALLLFS